MFGWDYSSLERLRAAESTVSNPYEHRRTVRFSCLDPLVVVPCGEDEWQFDRAFAVITHDVSALGLSICHTAPMGGKYLIESHSSEHKADHPDDSPQYFSATTRHCTPLDLGFWLIGLEAEESITLDHSQNEWLAERIAALRQVAAETERAFSYPG